MIECSVQKELEATRLSVKGRLDSMTSPDVQQQIDTIIQDGARMLIVDIEQISFVSSAGLRVFIAAQKQLTKAGGQVIIYRITPQVREVFAMSGFEKLFTFAYTADEIADALRQDRSKELVSVKEINGISLEYISLTKSEPTPLHIIGSQKKLAKAGYDKNDIVQVHTSDVRFGAGLASSSAQDGHSMDFFGEAVLLNGTLFFYPAVKRPVTDFMLCGSPEAELTYNFLYGFGFGLGYSYFVSFEHSERFITVAELADALSHISQNPAFGIVLLAESKGLWGMHLKKVPCMDNAPQSGEIFDEANFTEWMNFPVEPESINSVIAGAGIVVPDRSKVSEEVAHIVPSGSRLHLHAAVFEREPLKRNINQFDNELQRVITELEVHSVQHLLDKSVLSSGMVGIVELANC